MSRIKFIRSFKFLTTVGLACLAFPATAFQPLITDDTGTQGSAGNQLEFSFNQEHAKTTDETVRSYSLPVGYTRGITDSIDLFAGYTQTRIRSSTPGGDASGSSNPNIGAKWRFYENEDNKTSLALKPEILLPISADREESGLGAGKTSGKRTLILTQEVPFGAIHINAGIGRERFRDTENNPDTTTVRASIAPVWDFSDQWKLALDMGVEQARANSNRVRTSFIEFGAIYSPSKDLDLAVGMVRLSDNDSPHTTTYAGTAGITWRFQ